APLVEALQDEFYIDTSMIREAVQHRTSFNVIHLETMYKVDVFVQPAHAWAKLELTRRRLERVGAEPDSITLHFCSPQDIILHKLDWYRQGDGISDRQWEDVLGVLKVQEGQLDAGYLRHWANELRLTDLLEGAVRDADVML